MNPLEVVSTFGVPTMSMGLFWFVALKLLEALLNATISVLVY